MSSPFGYMCSASTPAKEGPASACQHSLSEVANLAVSESNERTHRERRVLRLSARDSRERGYRQYRLEHRRGHLQRRAVRGELESLATRCATALCRVERDPLSRTAPEAGPEPISLPARLPPAAVNSARRRADHGRSSTSTHSAQRELQHFPEWKMCSTALPGLSYKLNCGRTVYW